MVTLFRSAIAATRERYAHLRENPEEGIETIEIVIWAAIIGAFLIILGPLITNLITGWFNQIPTGP